MGIVLKQSFINTFILFFGFAIGGINVLFLYTHFLHEDYFGLITFLLSTANILLPLLVFGMQHTIIKYFSTYKTAAERDGFLISTLIIPLVVIIPLGLIGTYVYESIATWLSQENPLIKNYTNLIFIVAIFMGYFEVFYAWTKVQLKTVVGNFIKEIFARICSMFLLLGLYLEWLTNEQFIYAIVVVYGLRAIIMLLYALYVYRPKLLFKKPSNFKEIISFSGYMIVAGSAAGILLEIDKFMIPQMEQIAKVAYYSVGIYIASVVAIPTRAMQQITSPITAKDMNAGKLSVVESLYKQTSINLLVLGGLLFLIINLNIVDLYEIINKPEFTEGIWIVLIISVAKLVELSIGTANAILVNSNYYKMFFYLSLAMAVSVIVLNHWLIAMIGINGAALATLIVVAVYSFIKIIYIKEKFNIQPFEINSVKVLIIVIAIFSIFYFWNFGFHPVVNIILKTVLIAVMYGVLIKKFQISKDINSLITKLF